MALSVSLVSRTGQIWAGKARQVIAPSMGGSLGILPGREPILAALQAGTVIIDDDSGQRRQFQVDAGFISVDADQVGVIVEHVQPE